MREAKMEGWKKTNERMREADGSPVKKWALAKKWSWRRGSLWLVLSQPRAHGWSPLAFWSMTAHLEEGWVEVTSGIIFGSQTVEG